MINTGLCQHMHAFQVQQLQSLHPGTLKCKSLQLKACRVTIAKGNGAAKLCTQVHCCRKAGNINTTLRTCINCNLGGYRVRVPTQGHAFNCMLSGIVHVYRCTSYYKLGRLCTFMYLWQSCSLDFIQVTV